MDLLVHFQNWQSKLSDKRSHSFFFVYGGPGCGKSRNLDQFLDVLASAAAELPNSEDLQGRLRDVCTFKISFDNGRRNQGIIPAANLIPAHMAFQLQDSTQSWDDFCNSTIAKEMTASTVFQQLARIRGVENVADLTVIILLDSIQETQDAVKGVLQTVCDLTNSAKPFVIVACSATIQVPIREFLSLTSQRFLALSPPQLAAPQDITSIFEEIPSYDDRLIARLMIHDMGGHGRALELLLEVLQRYDDLALFDANRIMNEVMVVLQRAYVCWNPFQSRGDATAVLLCLISGRKLAAAEIIPGTHFTVDRMLQIGLFRYDAATARLSVAYVWALLMLDWVDLPELKALVACDYNQLKDKLSHGSSATLSFAAFEEFWCAFRSVRSRLHSDGKLVNWMDLHSGAFFTSNCDCSVRNRHLNIARASQRFDAKTSSARPIQLLNVSLPQSRDLLLDKVILNAPGAPSADSMVVLEQETGELCAEGHQDKRLDVSNLSHKSIIEERNKAVDQTDFLIIICTGRVDKRNLDRLPDRIAIIDADCYEEYFGPFAGRAYYYGHAGPWDVNSASLYQLQKCIGIGPVLAREIDTLRRKERISGPEHFKAKMRKFGDPIMEQFSF